MRLKSILIVVDKFPTTFGHTTYVKEVASKLQKMGFKVAIGGFHVSGITVLHGC